MRRVAVIMAGGAGERFWPLSRQSYPKQLLKIAGNRSMLGAAVERMRPLVALEDIYVVTSRALKPAIEAEAGGLAAANVLAEPAGKNTAACLALACAFLEHRYGAEGDVSTVVLTADHFIRDTDAFVRDCTVALNHAETHADLVTFGVPPDRPETGYGYIEMGDAVEGGGTFRVASFREKPNLETACEFQRAGRFFWNSGMFVWRNSTLRAAFGQHLPEMAAQIGPLRDAYGAPDPGAALDAAFAPVPKVSIDYGIMEKAPNVAVVKATFDWDDIGTWASLGRLLGGDAEGNVAFGNAEVIDCTDCIAYSVAGGDVAPRPPLLVGFGLRDVVLVQTQDAVLVLPREKVQLVKDVVARLRAAKKEEYL
jgi:mannose-1-phosphate guanylyltransferase